MGEKDLELLKKDGIIYKLSKEKENLKHLLVSRTLLCMLWVFMYSIAVLPTVSGVLLVVYIILLVLLMFSLIYSVFRIKKDY